MIKIFMRLIKREIKLSQINCNILYFNPETIRKEIDFNYSGIRDFKV